MFINETKTIKAGKEGSKEVEYSTVKENGKVIEKTKITEKVIEQPTDEIVIKGTKIPVSGTGYFIWPTSGGIITSDYGARWGTTHDGLDIAYPVDYTIKAAADGTVIFAGWMDGYGNTLLIDHGNGLETLYAHLSSFSATKGDKVAKGEKIGVMGNTGRSTGTHLHFEVRVYGEPRNPLNYVEI